jgi:RimJ/RimL family protein N-acetyltransferase
MAELPFPDPALQDGLIRLRPWSAADVPAIVAACQDISIARWSPVIPFPYTERDATGWLAMQEPQRRAGESLDLAIVEAESEAVAGAIGLNAVSGLLRSAEVGYWLVAPMRGRGYMTAAVRLLARWAFEHLELARLALPTDPENVESQRVAERCGFHREGRLRSHMLVRHSGERRDSLVYGLLPGELHFPPR